MPCLPSPASSVKSPKASPSRSRARLKPAISMNGLSCESKLCKNKISVARYRRMVRLGAPTAANAMGLICAVFNVSPLWPKVLLFCNVLSVSTQVAYTLIHRPPASTRRKWLRPTPIGANRICSTKTARRTTTCCGRCRLSANDSFTPPISRTRWGRPDAPGGVVPGRPGAACPPWLEASDSLSTHSLKRHSEQVRYAERNPHGGIAPSYITPAFDCGAREDVVSRIVDHPINRAMSIGINQ